MKRAFDFVMAFAGLIVTSPVFVVVFVINRLTGNDVFFIQQRVGEKSKPFPLIKFATMVKNAHIVGGTVTCKGDSRVTRVGRILRKCKINEVPQLINVLGGNMSFVGPRPLPTTEVGIYPPRIAKKIYSVKPGITGLASLYFYNEEMLLSHDKESAEATFRTMIMPKKAELELWYIDNRRFLLDLKIIIATVLVVCIRNHKILSFVSKRLGGSEVREKTETILKMQDELRVKDINMLVK